MISSSAFDRFVKHPLASLLLPALVGAIFGYAAATIQQNQDTKARRDALFHMLQDELRSIPNGVPPYNRTLAFYRDPIHLAVLPLLLDGRSLNFPQHEAVLVALLNLNVALSKYNNFISV